MVRHFSTEPTMEDCHKVFCQFYRNQIGGALPVFHGSDQYGEGLGDILRSVFRFLMPIASSAASKFIKTTSSGLDAGQSLGHAAKTSILPTIGEAVLGAAQQGLSHFQTGKGRKKSKHRKYKRNGTSRKSKSPKTGTHKLNQHKRRRVYKGKKRNAKRIRFLPTNF